MVGAYVPLVFRDVEIVLTDIVSGFQTLDITDLDSVRRAIDRAKPEVILHLAAATDVDRCELEPEWAHRLERWKALAEEALKKMSKKPVEAVESF